MVIEYVSEVARLAQEHEAKLKEAELRLVGTVRTNVSRLMDAGYTGGLARIAKSYNALGGYERASGDYFSSYRLEKGRLLEDRPSYPAIEDGRIHGIVTVPVEVELDQVPFETLTGDKLVATATDIENALESIRSSV